MSSATEGVSLKNISISKSGKVLPDTLLGLLVDVCGALRFLNPQTSPKT